MSQQDSEAAQKRAMTSNTSELEAKKPKVDESARQDSPFARVGDQVEAIDNAEAETDEQGLRKTGAVDSEGRPVQELESLCMNCHEQGVTRLLFTQIPYFREVVLMSFECPHCGFKNSEIQPASEIQIKGVKYVLKVEEKEDMNRQVVKSDQCSCKFAELDVEIPPQRGQLTTVEGLLQQIYEDLSADQEKRKEIDVDTYNKVEEFLARVQSAREGGILPLTLTVDDPAGNSWVQFIPGEASHKWSRVEYFRTKEQSRAIGLSVPDDEPEADKSGEPQGTTSINDDDDDIENLHNEVQRFHTQCPSCHRDCFTQMKVVNIPHFKDVIIMATSCDYCGYKSNEVKTGGAIPEKGRRIALRVTEKDDLARDILKSETCGLAIPELEMNLVPGTLGGRFTTIEGLLNQVHDELHSRVFTETSDSMDKESVERWEKFLGRLKTAIAGDMVFHIIMEDPLAASYIQNVYAPDEDPNMVIEDFERTEEQNEDLGITDMNVDQPHEQQ